MKISTYFLVCFTLGQFLSPTEVRADLQSLLTREVIRQDLRISLRPQIQAKILTQWLEKDRDYAEVELICPESNLEATRLLLSGPPGFIDSTLKRPALFLTAGFSSGMNSIKLVTSPKDWILVGYEYPAKAESIARDPSLLPKSVRQIPGQLLVSLIWLHSQKWISPENFIYMGVSLGTLFLPVSLALAQDSGLSVPRSIFAFGGAEVGPIFTNYLHNRIPPNIAAGISNLVDGVMTPYHPSFYLSELHGQFLVIQGEHDDVFPRVSRDRLVELLPQPKQIENLNARHIDPTQTEVIQETISIVEKWAR